MIDTIIKAVIGTIITAAWTGLVAAVKVLYKRQKAEKRGVKSLLRADIIRSYDKYTEKGYCPIYARDALEEEYKSYHELGGNGTITHLWELIQSLPTEPKAVNGDEE